MENYIHCVLLMCEQKKNSSYSKVFDSFDLSANLFYGIYLVFLRNTLAYFIFIVVFYSSKEKESV